MRGLSIYSETIKIGLTKKFELLEILLLEYNDVNTMSGIHKNCTTPKCLESK